MHHRSRKPLKMGICRPGPCEFSPSHSLTSDPTADAGSVLYQSYTYLRAQVGPSFPVPPRYTSSLTVQAPVPSGTILGILWSTLLKLPYGPLIMSITPYSWARQTVSPACITYLAGCATEDHSKHRLDDQYAPDPHVDHFFEFLAFHVPGHNI